jgi:hypothetical protein
MVLPSQRPGRTIIRETVKSATCKILLKIGHFSRRESVTTLFIASPFVILSRHMCDIAAIPVMQE